MSYELLVVAAESTAPEANVQKVLATDGEFHCESWSWGQVVCQGLPPGGYQGVVAVAAPSADLLETAFARRETPPRPIFAILPADAGETHVRAAARVADDFALQPVHPVELRFRLRRMLGRPTFADVQDRLLAEVGMTQLFGRDPAFVRAIENVPRFARSDLPVLISGETGTGKELCARALHFLSRRRDLPFIAVDCGALPDQLFENEMFGHVRGAYTDANGNQMGLVAMAEGGTLFLDEIHSLSLAAQGKLLRFLEDRSYRRLGSDRFERADVNVIAATNCNLDERMNCGEFRRDLFYRLNILRLHLPPLRQRRADIGPLAQHVLSTSTVSPGRTLSASALSILASASWPGNVRELLNVVRRSAVLCDGSVIYGHHIAAALPTTEGGASTSFRRAREEAVAAFERSFVETLLHKNGGNVSSAAREAQKERRAFGRLVKKYGIDRRRAAG